MTVETESDVRAGKFFHRFADTFDSLYDGKRGPVWRFLDARFRRDIVERFELTFQKLGDLTGKTVLDIGCGSGVYMREALARGAAKVIGVDPAPRMLDLAAQRLGREDGRYQLVCDTFPAKLPVDKADAAIVMGVMDYVPDAVGFLSSLREQLAGGMAAISFPSRHWLRSPIREVRYKLRNCPIYLYRRRDIESVLSRAQMTPVSIEKIDGAGQDFHVVCR
jgi:SAM-dependent methyltransferase